MKAFKCWMIIKGLSELRNAVKNDGHECNRMVATE